MNKKTTSQLKDYILIVMGLVSSIAGIIFIIVQYTKLLSAPSLDEESDHVERVDKKLRSHFKQIHKEEGISPEQKDEGDLAIELE